MAPEVHEPDPSEPVPWQQRFLDNPYLLLLLGVGVTALFYTLWGLLEMRLMPTAPLP